jgi:sn-glycerol 3-phosphate transport system ATP-binding protein
MEIQKLHRQLGTTTLYVTHDQVEAMTLANRMIVMNAGRAEQIGAPMEVYVRPATRFVAGFIGSPAMNFIPGRAQEGALTVKDGSIVKLPGGVPAALAGRDIVLGVRPEHLEVCSDADAAFKAQVEMIEQLGADTLAHCSIAGEIIIVRLPKDSRAAVGDHLPLRPQTGQLHFFEGESGARI